jgi:hypothetical protein
MEEHSAFLHQAENVRSISHYQHSFGQCIPQRPLAGVLFCYLVLTWYMPPLRLPAKESSLPIISFLLFYDNLDSSFIKVVDVEITEKKEC